MDTAITLTFKLVEGSSPLIIRLNQKHADTMNDQFSSITQMKKPIDEKVKTIYTFLRGEGHENDRLCLDLVLHSKTTTNHYWHEMEKSLE